MYCKSIIFTKAPLLKAFRYRDSFQLVPISYSQYAPFSMYASHFPAFLEYEVYDNKENKLAIEDTMRKMGIPPKVIMYYRKLPKQTLVRKEILHLLSALTNFHFFEYGTDVTCWGIRMPYGLRKEEKEVLINQTSYWTIGGYVYPNLKKDLHISCFTDCNLHYENVESPVHYFTYNPYLGENKEIKIPPYLDFVIDRYFSMDDEDRYWVRQCVGLLNDGIDLFDSKRSVSLLSIISSIEGMALLDYKKFGKAKGLGPKNRFLRYLKIYVTDRSVEKFKTYYEKRCAITHEGFFFLKDTDLYANDEDWLLRLEILQVARLALYNWLRQYRER